VRWRRLKHIQRESPHQCCRGEWNALWPDRSDSDQCRAPTKPDYCLNLTRGGMAWDALMVEGTQASMVPGYGIPAVPSGHMPTICRLWRVPILHAACRSS